ncbi:spermidine/putrescine ABC transporter substrate-binding protein [Microbacterium sp. NPDC058389]|uniref:polyamine ABC transporter substrate-binding protein n=1 Tax=Microbacterium sp. NPDC058389 TaxID=3346475 RepID=UPI003646738B
MPESPIRILASSDAVPTIRRELSRRGFLGIAAAAGAAAILTACSPGGGTSAAPKATGGALESKLSIYTWGDYDSPDVIDAFTKEQGPTVELSSFNSNEEMIAKLTAAKGTGGYDIVVPTGVYIQQMVQNGLLQKLNLELIPNFKNLDAAFVGRAWDPDNEYSICKDWGTTGFVYDKTVITRELSTWSDFLDAAQNEASGKTSMLDDASELTGAYFWANGIPWTTTDEGDLDAAEDFLVNTLAPHLEAFDSYPGGGAIQQASHVLMQAYNGDVRLALMETSEPDRWHWVLAGPKTEIWMDNWSIPTGAPHPEAAHAFINYVLDPAASLQELDYIGYHTGVANIEQAAADAGLELLDMVFFTPEQLATMEEGEVNDSLARVVDIYNKVKAAAGA